MGTTAEDCYGVLQKQTCNGHYRVYESFAMLCI